MRRVLVCLLTTVAFSAAAFAQDLEVDFFQAARKPAAEQVAQVKIKTDVAAAFIETDTPNEVELQVRLTIPVGLNSYSMNPDVPKPTKILFEKPEGWKDASKDWTCDPTPKKSYDSYYEQEIEKLTGTVVFSRRYVLPAGTDVKALTREGKVNFLVCDSSTCTPMVVKFVAEYSAKSLKPEKKNRVSFEEILSKPGNLQWTALETEDESTAAGGADESLRSAYQKTPLRKTIKGETPDPVRLQFELSPAQAKAGEIVTLAVTMTLEKNWSTYGLEKADDTQPETPTTITIAPDNLEAVDKLASFPPPEVHEAQLGNEVTRSNAHEHRVTWLQKFKVLSDAPYGLSGQVRYQICEKGTTCRAPLSVLFSLGNQQDAPHLVGASAVTESFTNPEATAAIAPRKGASSDMTMFGAFLAAFLAGLIMNVLPCVLPVLAIKVLSLVQQAGESRSRIIALNLTYTAGVMAVFMGFAVLSWGLGQSFASVFQNTIFMIVMACVVFIMGLSLFGVFELPVPGIIPSAGHHHEGYVGAFNTGIIATILGTPCIGPFIAPVFTWTLTQPASIVFSIFGMMGLGMAFPFLLTGIFPSLVNWFPRPGDWMVKFKQFTGFVLMGTVIWLLLSIPMEYRVPVLVLLLALSLLVWLKENLAAHHDPVSKKVRARLIALGASAPIFLAGLWMIREFDPDRVSKMEWKPFSEELLVQYREEGRPLLIDFTANWCVICKWNEKVALDRDETVQFVNANGFVPIMADFTYENPEILKWLREFGEESVPLTIIYPPGKSSQPIPLRGQYTKKTLLKNLREAMSEANSEGAAAPEVTRAASGSAESLTAVGR